MFKKMLAILPLTFLSLSMLQLPQKTLNSPLELQNSVLLDQQDVNYLKQKSFNPEYPSFLVDANEKNKEHRANVFRYKSQDEKLSAADWKYDAEQEASKGYGVAQKEWTFLELDTKLYSKNQQDFKSKYTPSIRYKKMYNTMNMGSNYQLDPNIAWAKNWKAETTTELKFSTDAEWIKIDGLKNPTNGHLAEYYYKCYFTNDTLIIKMKVLASISYNSGSTYRHAAVMGIIPIDVEFKTAYQKENFKNKVITEAAKPISYKSYNGTEIDSTTLKSYDGVTRKSNKEAISELAITKVKNSFSGRWQEFEDFGLTIGNLDWSKSKERKVIVPLVWNDAPKTSWADITVNVNLNVDESYYRMDIQERLSINPTMVPDINNPSQVVLDKPEFRRKENNVQEFTYHNSVNISFGTNTKDEVVYINGDPLEVYENTFSAELLDGRDEDNNGNNIYRLELKKAGQNRLDIIIIIDSKNPNIDFKWLGWDPQEDETIPWKYQQWVLTQPTIKEEQNPLYDPSINPKTGIRNQNIFIRENPLLEPFLLDPKDRNGIIIKPEDKDKEKRLNYGYIAQAAVVNSGIENIFKKEELQSFSKIERIQVNPVTLEEIGKRENLDITKEVQFSNKGLFHYVFYINDFVNQEVDPKNPPSNDVLATQGSAIHKFLYIDNSQEAYKKLTDLPEIKKNNKIEDFDSNFSSQNLKRYLITRNVMSAKQDFSLMNYEKIIRYWKNYVSNTLNGKNTDKDKPIDSRLDISLNPVNLTTKKFNKLNLIETAVNETIYTFENQLNVSNLIYKEDFFIMSEPYIAENVEKQDFIEDMDLSDLIDISEKTPTKQQTFIIKSGENSKKLIGSTRLNITNDFRFVPEKYMNLASVKFKDFEYNFRDASQELKDAFKQNYIIDYVSNTLFNFRPEAMEENEVHVYGTDYTIHLDDSNIDIYNQEEVDKYLMEFLNSNYRASLKVTVRSVSGSLYLGGYKSYYIKNDPFNGKEPPIKPDPEIKPPPIPPTLKTNKKNYWFIALVPIIGVSLVVTFMLIKRSRKTRTKQKIS